MFARFSPWQFRGFVLALLASLVGAGVSAHAGLASLGDATRAVAAERPTGFDAQDHFPGAALFEAVNDAQPSAPGATGTIALPDLPVPPEAAAADPLDGTIHPAQPFHLAGTLEDRARALQCLTTAIYYEAAREPDAGQRAVAQVILNRVRHPAFPATVCGVVFQGSERAGCQFSFACDGAMAHAPAAAWWDRARRVAAAALAGQVFAPVGMATHYHTYAVTPAWNRKLVMTAAIGAHFFHRWQGWWGTPAAFTQAYRGGEPFPGPHAPVMTIAAAAPVLPAVPPLALPTQAPALAGAAPFVAPAPAPKPAAPATIQPRYADSGTVQPRYAGSSLPESTVLDRWKDSGQPLH